MEEKRNTFLRAKAKKLKEDKTLDRNRVTNYVHTGFAFSGAAGQDRMVTDNLNNRLKDAMAKALGGGLMMQSQDLEKKSPLLTNLNKIGTMINSSVREENKDQKQF